MRKFRNTLPYADATLKSMVRWIARQVGMPLGKLGPVTFRYGNRRSWSGMAYYADRSIICRLGARASYPQLQGCARGARSLKFDIHDPWDALVVVTAHELTHQVQRLEGAQHKLRKNVYRNGYIAARARGLERATQAEAVRVLKIWQAQRLNLLPQWNGEDFCEYVNPSDQPTI